MYDNWAMPPGGGGGADCVVHVYSAGWPPHLAAVHGSTSRKELKAGKAGHVFMSEWRWEAESMFWMSTVTEHSIDQ